MSVHKRGRYYHYEFWVGGVRFRGSTKKEEKKAAKRVEKRLKKDAEAKADLPPENHMTLGVALKKYNDEHACNLASAPTIEYQLHNLLRLGKKKKLAEITDADLAKYVVCRQNEVSPSSTNREITLFRAVTNRAHKNWGIVKPVINWQAHIDVEPAPTQNTLSPEKEAELLGHLPESLHPFIIFCIHTGARLGSVINLTWKDVDFQNMAASLRVKSRRAGERHTIPLTPDLVTLLANEKGNHPIYVFTYVCTRNRPKRKVGERYKLTETNWRRFWQKARKKAGIPNFRFHDLRHTAATRLLQSSGNLRIVQKLLGHKDIKTTTRYAHVQVDDIRDAMMNLTTHKIPHNGGAEIEEKEQKG